MTPWEEGEAPWENFFSMGNLRTLPDMLEGPSINVGQLGRMEGRAGGGKGMAQWRGRMAGRRGRDGTVQGKGWQDGGKW